jgi:hypothetical protein
MVPKYCGAKIPSRQYYCAVVSGATEKITICQELFLESPITFMLSRHLRQSNEKDSNGRFSLIVLFIFCSMQCPKFICFDPDPNGAPLSIILYFTSCSNRI